MLEEELERFFFNNEGFARIVIGSSSLCVLVPMAWLPPLLCQSFDGEMVRSMVSSRDYENGGIPMVQRNGVRDAGCVYRLTCVSSRTAAGRQPQIGRKSRGIPHFSDMWEECVRHMVIEAEAR